MLFVEYRSEQSADFLAMSRVRRVSSLLLSLSAAKLSACAEMRLTFGTKARPKVVVVCLFIVKVSLKQSVEEGERIILNGMKEFCAEE